MSTTLFLLGFLSVSAPELLIEPTTAQPGDAVLIRVREEKPSKSMSARLGKQRVYLYRTADGWEGVGAVPIDAKPGTLNISAGKSRGTLAVEERKFEETKLQVEDRFVNPDVAEKKQMAADSRALSRAFSRKTTPPLFTDRFIWPAKGDLSSRFAEKRIFNDTKPSRHDGTDILIGAGGNVEASNDGVVVFAGDTFLSGQMILIDHGAGIFTGYFHLSAIGVEEGQKISRGDSLGKVGATGRTTGPHLHFAVRVAGDYVDPEGFMKLRLSPLDRDPIATRR